MGLASEILNKHYNHDQPAPEANSRAVPGCATIACHVCKTEARPTLFGDVPEGWGFVEDEDRDAPGGRGFWYACAECKER